MTTTSMTNDVEHTSELQHIPQQETTLTAQTEKVTNQISGLATSAIDQHIEQVSEAPSETVKRLIMQIFELQWARMPVPVTQGRNFAELLQAMGDEPKQAEIMANAATLSKPTILGIEDGNLLIADGVIVELSTPVREDNANYTGLEYYRCLRSIAKEAGIFEIMTLKQAGKYHRINGNFGICVTAPGAALNFCIAKWNEFTNRLTVNQNEHEFGIRRTYEVPLDFKS